MLLCICVLLSVVPLSEGLDSGIIGGKEVKPHSRKHMASLQCKRHHRCGGTLIKDNYILTSKHCLDDTCKILEVVLGAHNLSQSEKSQQIIEVEKYIKHPFYDIMLLKLKTKATLNEFVGVIDLPQTNKKMPALVKCTIAGWGMKKRRGAASSVLNEVDLKLQFSFECKNMWKEYFNSTMMICTASDGKKAFCQGDSGSPLICESKFIGMAAYTYPDNCLNKKYPEVYMKIPAFLQWIKEKVIDSV